MTRQEHLKFCTKCHHQKMDRQQGIICSLTGNIADFETECSDYREDESNKATEHIRSEQIENNKEQGKKDMLYGAIWCMGGILATAADIGYIFYGAIIYGAIQFVRGASNQ